MATNKEPRPVPADIRPLVVRTQPNCGEQLSSVLVRACEANVFTKIAHLLDLIGLSAQASEAVPFTHAIAAPAIAKLLGTTTGEIESRMHPPTHDDLGRPMVSWYGGSIERRHLEAAVRRYAPRSLEQCEYYHATWAVRLLDYCPVTMEYLLSACPRCSRPLSWRACRFLLKCDKCGASLLNAKSRTLPPQLHDAAKLGAALVSPKPNARTMAVSSLGNPFNTWDPADALTGILTLGAAQCWLKNEHSTEAIGSAACVSAGIDFAREWPESLSKYVKASVAKSNSTSFRTGLGPLGRLLGSTAKTTPIRDLARSNISTALAEGTVPVKLHSGASINEACRAGMLTAMEAANQLGICLKRLRRLEGRSETFLARHNVKGGAALYNEAAILRLAKIVGTSAKYGDAARLLGIPRYCVSAFASVGLIESVNDKDANIITEAPLIARASIAVLRERLLKRSRAIEGGVTLRKAMQRVGDPQDWITILQGLLAGQIPFGFDQSDDFALSDTLIVRAVDIARRVSGRTEGPGISGIDVCCQTAAGIIGTTQQFVAAAVKAGFVDGEVGLRNSAIPLHSVLKIREQFVFTEELRQTFGSHTRTIASQLRKAGLRPAATINRINVWRRSDIQRYIAKKDAPLGANNENA